MSKYCRLCGSETFSRYFDYCRRCRAEDPELVEIDKHNREMEEE